MSQATDPLAIAEAVQRRLMTAWRIGNGEAFGAACTDDADFVNLIGVYVRGREAIAGLHQRIFDGFYAGSTMTLVTERTRFLTPGIVLTQAAAEVQVPAGPLQGVVRGFVTMVLVRAGQEWLVASFQNTRREGSAPDQGARLRAALDQAA